MLLFLTAASLSSCGQSKNVNETPINRAYRLIDEDRDQDAIAILLEQVEAHPDSAECKAALASAYAHHAGFKIQEFGNFFVDSKKMSDISDTFTGSNNKVEEIEFKVDDFALNFSNLLLKYSKMMSVYKDIPSIKKENEIYLEEAIKIMESIKAPRQSDGTYLAVLRAVQFKYFVAADLVGSIGNTQLVAGNCTLNLDAVTTSITKLGRLLMGVYDAMATANPSKLKQFNEQKAKIADQTFSLTLIVTGMSVADEASKLFVQHAVVEEGFGKLLTCKAEPTNSH